MLSKEFPGGVLVMTGANSAVGLRSMAARYLFLDEVDAYPLDVDGEGDPIVLAMARARTFTRRKIFLCSTPLSSGSSRIEAAYEESDKRRYFVPCPFCNHFQILEFGRIRWENKDPETAAYFCVACEGRIENHEKTVMLERGEWRATAVGDGKTVGFHLPSYYSPVGWFSFADAARMFISASTKGAQQLLRVFTNTVDASTWKELGEAPDWQRLYERAQAEALPYNRKVPQAGLFLTAGADVQKDRIEVQVVAWGRGKESWLIDYEVLAGDTSRPEVWEKLTEYAGRSFTHESGTQLPITRFAIDSGAETQMVYSWVRSQDGSRVLAVKGADHGIAIVGLPTSVDITSAGKRARRAAKVWPVNVSALKSELYGWLKLDMPTVERGESFPPGYCHFPQLGEEFFRQLTAEQLIIRIVKGYRKSEWQKARERNEALDTRIYARAAASQFGMDRFTEQHWTALEKQIGITAKPLPPQQQVATSTPPPARQDFNRNERVIDPFHRLDYKPRWLGDRNKRWFDR